MGVKGDKDNAMNALTADFLAEKLIGIPEITFKKMFGGYGFFATGKMFGIIDAKGQAYLKANESNLDQFTKLGAAKHSRMPYYAIPEEVLANVDKLEEWAKQSIAINA